jgi:hypothetical protein
MATSNSKNIAEFLNGDTTITATDIANNAVTADKIATDSVTVNKILDGAVTAAKINSAVALGGPSLGTASVIRTNAKVIAENITFAGNENGLTIGPVTVNSSYTVTVASGSTWVIL